MRVRYEGGILVQEALKEVILDPARKTPGSIVSHGHMDHLTSGGIMTPQTVAVLKVRRGGTVTLGYRCERCKYWTGLKRRVPTRYIFTRRS